MKHFLFYFFLAFHAITLSNSLTFVVMRHGQSDHNVAGVFNSNPNHPDYFISHLTDMGKAQIKDNAVKLIQMGIDNDSIQQIFVSPLPRTKETAQVLINNGVVSADKMIVDSRIIEVQIGDWEGKHWSNFPEDSWDNPTAEEYGGENEEQVYNRIASLYQEIIRTYTNGVIIIVTHGSPALQMLKVLTEKGERIGEGKFRIIEITQ